MGVTHFALDITKLSRFSTSSVKNHLRESIQITTGKIYFVNTGQSPAENILWEWSLIFIKKYCQSFFFISINPSTNIAQLAAISLPKCFSFTIIYNWVARPNCKLLTGIFPEQIGDSSCCFRIWDEPLLLNSPEFLLNSLDIFRGI